MIKNLLKRSFDLAGLDIRRKRKMPPERKPPYPFVQFGVDVVFDVGANEGQYGFELRHAGYRNRIVSFEPLPDAHAFLQEQTKQDPLWTIHERVAIGAREGKSVINISGNKLSSSLLPMLASHSDAAPESAYVGKADVNVIALDSVFDRYVSESETPALKIDAQGFEHEVLEGVSAYLDRFTCILVELSTVPLYQDQKTYEWFISFFKTHGFYLWWLKPGFTDPVTGQTLQFDACFARDTNLATLPVSI
jgi:FkbM family methyltransferase